MRLVYFGTADFAVPALRAVAESVVLVVSQPDRPTGRGLTLRPSPVKVAAASLGLLVSTPEKCRSAEFVEVLRSLEADALLVAAYGQILSQAVLDSARCGGINLHGSILPDYRGAAPIQRTILDGRSETGVTLMQMDKGMDSGDIIAIETLTIGPDETAGQLTPRLSDLAADMAARWMPRIVSGDYPRVRQDASLATFAPKVAKEEAELRFDRAAKAEYNRFRAFSPSPGPFFDVGDAAVKLLVMGRAEGQGEPGTILAIQPDLVVAFAEGALTLIQLQPAGKKPMSGRDWANGRRLRIGDRLV